MGESEFQDVSVKEGYALWAASYDQEKNGLIFIEERRVNDILAQLSFTNVLDVGTGTGRHALKLARQNANVTAIDQSSEMLAVARLTAQREHLPIDFHLASLEDGLSFEANQFDLVTCALMLSHVPDLTHSIEAFARVLQDGGYLLISDFHPVHVIYEWKTSFSREGVKYSLPTVGYTRDDYLAAIKTSGLTILDVQDIPMSEVPEGYLPDEVWHKHADKPFCLIILAQK